MSPLQASGPDDVGAGAAWPVSPHRSACAVLVLAALMLGCTRVAPGIVLAPQMSAEPAVLRAPPIPPISPAAAQVVRDTRALRRQADGYVTRRDSDPAVLRNMTTLQVQLGRAVDRMRRGRSRPADVIAARVAADALAAFLQTQAQ